MRRDGSGNGTGRRRAAGSSRPAARVAPVALGALAVLAVLAVLAGCGAGPGGDEAADSAEGAAARQEPAGPAAGAPGDQDAETGGEAAGVVDTRHIIYTGSITVRVADVADTARAATALAEQYGGFVGADRRAASEDAPAEATLVLRIPSDKFTAAVAELGELGEEASRRIDTEDVTEEVVDLETRIATAEASVARTRTLLERAESIDDIVTVEEELAEREANLASLQARQRDLADRTALSTITARLRTHAPAEPDEDSGTGFLAGLGAGWRGFTASATVGLTVLGVLLPWLLALGAPGAAAAWWFRRRRAVPPAV